ncbi:MAG: hypothetical protein AAGA54_03095 [Myxococcota bacterium]
MSDVERLDRYRLVTSRRPGALHAAARLAGVGVDTLVGRALRGLFVRGGVPYLGPRELERSLDMMQPYCDPAIRSDPDRIFAPATVPSLRQVRATPLRTGTHVHAVFPTPYRPVHGVFGGQWRRYDNVDTAHLFAWRHHRPAPLSMLLVHGWGVGAKRLHESEFGVDYFHRVLGLDVYYYVLPYHWVRKPSAATFSGELFPSGNLMRTNEGFVQTIQELRAIITMIKQRNPVPLGVMGSSLGGYTSALLSSVDDRLAFAVPVLPMGSLAELFWDQGDDDPIRQTVESVGMTRARLQDAWALHEPLNYAPKVPQAARMIVSATGDMLVPPSHTESLWRHWGRPEHVRFAGGHILQVYRRHYHLRVAQRLVAAGLLDAERVQRAHPRWSLPERAQCA